MLDFNDFLNEKKKSDEPIFTKYGIESFLKGFGYKLKYYYPNMSDDSIKIVIEKTDKAKRYDRMLDRFISLNYKKIKHIKNIKKEKEFIIYARV